MALIGGADRTAAKAVESLFLSFFRLSLFSLFFLLCWLGETSVARRHTASINAGERVSMAEQSEQLNVSRGKML